MKVKELINWLKECPEDMEVDIRILGKTFVDEYTIDDGPSIEGDKVILTSEHEVKFRYRHN